MCVNALSVLANFVASQKQQLQVERLLRRYQELTTLQAQINIQLTDLAMEQQVLLKEQQKWLRMLMHKA